MPKILHCISFLLKIATCVGYQYLCVQKNQEDRPCYIVATAERVFFGMKLRGRIFLTNQLPNKLLIGNLSYFRTHSILEAIREQFVHESTLGTCILASLSPN